MKHRSSNKWLEPDPSWIDSYLSSSDVLIVERYRMLKILSDICGYHFDKCQNLMMLDLGCGDGIVTKYIREKYPHNNFTLMDGSLDMIEKAKKNLTGDDVSFVHKTFENYISSTLTREKFDLVYSAWAIHHLDIDWKGKLYAKVFGEMRPGGLFIVMDTVQPPTERSEKWQFRMWTDWMNETLQKIGFIDDIGKYNNVPSCYKSQEEDKPSPLSEQTELLTKVGFKDVDCFFKYGVFSLFGGIRSE